ncbi:MAG: DUF1464 family protein [Chloroflexota bacterium]
MRVVGVDPGTLHFDICGLEDGELKLDLTFSSEVVAKEPERLVNIIAGFSPDLIVGPSGYGVPLRSVAELTPDDRFEMTLERVEDRGKIPVLVGLQKMVDLMREREMPVYFIPGVVHLPSVPPWRKVNRIDMGTADKMAIGVLGVYRETQRRKLPFNKVSVIVVEMGFGYNAALAVAEGRIVDGIGGSVFPGPAYLNMGALDGEVAYLLYPFEKLALFSGGVLSVVGAEMAPEAFWEKVQRQEEKACLAYQAFVEGIVKSVSMERTVTPAQGVLLSGRLSRVPGLSNDIATAVIEKTGLEVNFLRGLGQQSKEAASGSAIIADGLARGRFQELITHMQVQKADGRLFDHMYIQGMRMVG